MSQSFGFLAFVLAFVKGDFANPGLKGNKDIISIMIIFSFIAIFIIRPLIAPPLLTPVF